MCPLGHHLKHQVPISLSWQGPVLPSPNIPKFFISYFLYPWLLQSLSLSHQVLQGHLLVLVHQVPDVLPSLGVDVVLARAEDQPKDWVLSEYQVLNKAQVSSSEDRFKMRNRRKALQKPCVSSMRKVPDNFHGCVPGSVQLKMFNTV